METTFRNSRLLVFMAIVLVIATFCGWKAGAAHQKDRCKNLSAIGSQVLRSQPNHYGHQDLVTDLSFYDAVNTAMDECHAY